MAREISRGAGAVGHAVATWAALFALYLLFAGKIAAPELAVGGVAAALAAAYQLALHYKNRAPRLPLAALRPLAPALGAMLRDTVRVAAALAAAAFVQPPPGRVRVLPPPTGAVPGSRGGRAVAIAAQSLAPDSFVVAGAFEAGRVVVHRLLDAPPDDPA